MFFVEQPSHIETVVKLVRKTPDAYIDLKVDMDELDLTASEAKATYQEIKDYIVKKHGVKVSSLYIAQIKQKHGIIERDCYNKSKAEEAKVPQCTPEKEKLIEEALRYFKMIHKIKSPSSLLQLFDFGQTVFKCNFLKFRIIELVAKCICH